eukprot:TRINITY_DN37852_c0_g1_i1.p1 TRINITY_DN37852_c0_g1~~TRINITY_DN37852_c0_g1_i1.p1  ORF type:complete len:179 (+),score=37.98 TRINITY_DN37852_c0_g1_i1:82-618(+)
MQAQGAAGAGPCPRRQSQPLLALPPALVEHTGQAAPSPRPTAGRLEGLQAAVGGPFSKPGAHLWLLREAALSMPGGWNNIKCLIDCMARSPHEDTLDDDSADSGFFADPLDDPAQVWVRNELRALGEQYQQCAARRAEGEDAPQRAVRMDAAQQATFLEMLGNLSSPRGGAASGGTAR